MEREIDNMRSKRKGLMNIEKSKISSNLIFTDFKTIQDWIDRDRDGNIEGIRNSEED